MVSGQASATGVETVRVTLTFDADNKILRAVTDLSVVPVIEVDIDEGDSKDWGMTTAFFELV